MQLNNNAPPANWADPEYDETLWDEGNAPFGSSSLDTLETELDPNASSYLLRTTFEIDGAELLNGERLAELSFSFRSTLDARILLNGMEVGRHLLKDHTTASPLGIPGDGLKIWVASDGPVELIEMDGDFQVAEWTDMSGHGNHLTASNSSNQPLWTEDSINGLSAASFNGISQRLQSANLSSGEELTVFVVSRADSSSSAWANVYTKGSNSAGLIYHRNNTTQGARVRIDTDGGFNQTQIGGNLFDGIWKQNNLRVNRDRLETRIDGITTINRTFEWGTSGIANNRPFVLGANYNGAGGFLRGEVAEVLFYDRYMSDEERGFVEAYLSRKYWNSGDVAEIKYDIPASLVAPGPNVLAVELLQQEISAENFVFDAKLSALLKQDIHHTNYSLSSDGEPVLLTRPNGSSADFIPTTALLRDVSYGRQPDGTGDWVFFERATPGQSNVSASFTGIVWESPSFTHPAGFYTEAFALNLLTNDPEATILYTLDGSEPSLDALDGRTYTYKMGSSAKFVGELWFWEFPKCMK